MFTYKLKFILLSQLIITMHIHCLHWLMSTGLLFQSAFCRPCKCTTSEITPMDDSNLAVGNDMTHTVSTRLSRPCCGILALCGHVDVIATLNSTICVILLLCFSLCHHPPYPHPPPTHHLIYVCWPKINKFHEKIIKNW